MKKLIAAVIAAIRAGVLYNKAFTELIYAPENLSGEIALPQSLSALPMFAFDGRSALTQADIGGGQRCRGAV